MKKLISIAFGIICFISTSNAQLTNTQVIDSVDSQSKYYFKEFSDGIVYLKNGQQSQAKLNYQMQDQVIAYIDEQGKRLIISNPNEIDSVQINGFVYIPVNTKFFELLETGSDKQLLLSMYGKVKPLSTTLVGTEVKTVSKNISSDDGSGAYLTRTQKRNTALEFLNSFWLKNNDGKLIRLKNIKQVVNSYPNKKSEILEFEKKNKTDFSRIQDVVDLIAFCNK